MTTADDVKKLAALARVEIPEAELAAFTKEFDAILAYVRTLETLNLASAREEKPQLANVLREDGTPYAPGVFTEKLVTQFPAREGNALSVKQVVEHD